MLKILIKKQLYDIFQTYFFDKKTGMARTKKGNISFLLLLVLLFVSLGTSFYGIASQLGNSILNNGINWLFFSIMSLLSMGLGVFASVFNTYSSLYLPKDNELMLSLPVKPYSIVFARLIGVYIISLVYSAWVWIPTIIAYYVVVPLTIANIILPILLTFIIALFVTILSCILGFIVALIASKTKGNNFLKVFISLFIMGAYYFVYFNVMDSLNNITEHIDSLSNIFKSWLYYIYLLGNAADGKVIDMLIITGITVIVAYICIAIISKTFMKLSIMKDNSRKIKSKALKYRKRNINQSVLAREYKMFTAYPTWMLNGGFGLLIMPVLAVVILIKINSVNEILIKLETMQNIFVALPLLVVVGVSFIISTNCILPSSISIEGKTLWQIKSLPIDTWKIVRSKEKMYVQMNMISSFPLILTACKILHIEYLEIILIYLCIYVLTYIIADYGLFLNIKKPNFNWTNVTAITKQGMPVLLSLYGGWTFNIVLGFANLYFASKISTTVLLLVNLILFTFIALILRNWLKNKGTKIFDKLN